MRRPAIYEVKRESTLADLLELAGGLTPEADLSDAMLTRIDASQHRVVVPIDLSAAAGKEPLRNGDLVRVMRLRPTLDSGIVVQGYLYTPGTFAYRQGIRLSDVIRSVDELRPDADIHYLLIRRELPPDRHISVLSADLAAAVKAPGSAADLELSPRDRITVFDLASGRDHTIQPLLDELRVQGTSGQPTETVHVDGQVKVPGEYPLEPGMRVSDLIRAGGGAADAAYSGQAELTRYSVVTGARHTELIEVDLAAAMRGDPAANIPLRAFDTLTVKEVPLWGAQESVTLRGEVRFPGSYSIRRGETLKSVIERAGGLTSYAFPQGSVFTRESAAQAGTGAARRTCGSDAAQTSLPSPSVARSSPAKQAVRRLSVLRSHCCPNSGSPGPSAGWLSIYRASCVYRPGRPRTSFCAAAINSSSRGSSSR